MRVLFVELLDLAMRAPLEVAATGVSQIEVRDFLEASHSVEPRGDLIGQRLVLHEAAIVGRSNGLFV
jgi:hypothetical protein